MSMVFVINLISIILTVAVIMMVHPKMAMMMVIMHAAVVRKMGRGGCKVCHYDVHHFYWLHTG